jgi:hypothetical protein
VTVLWWWAAASDSPAVVAYRDIANVLSVLVPVLVAIIAGQYALKQSRRAAEAERQNKQDAAIPAAYDQLVTTQSARLREAYERLGDVEEEQMRCRERQNETDQALREAVAYIGTLTRWIGEHVPGDPPLPPLPASLTPDGA